MKTLQIIENVPSGDIPRDAIRVDRNGDTLTVWERGDDVPPLVTPEQIAAAEAAPVPITARQARLALNAAGLRSQVEAAVSAGGLEIQDYWEYSTELHREHPIVAQMGAALGLSGEQLDALFRQAAAL